LAKVVKLSRDSFSFFSLGGSGEVGMNFLVFCFGETLVPVDAGILFAEPNDFGIESVHPNCEFFGKENFPTKWLITHGHEDHIGAAVEIFSAARRLGVPPPKVYAPSLALGLIKSKVFDDSRYGFDRNEALSCLEEITTGEDIELYPGIFVRFVENRHSIVQSCSLAFRWKSKSGEDLKILHTSDFKLDFNRYQDGVKNLEIFDCFKGASPDILLIDSTNAERDGHTVAETEIMEPLERLMKKCSGGRIFLSMFSSNVLRLANTLMMAPRLNRVVALGGRSLQNTFQIAKGLGLFQKYGPDFSRTEIVEPAKLAQFPPERQLIFCSGSQGEQRSVLMRLSQGTHQDYQIQDGDSVILSSKVIPGNEKQVSRLVNGLMRQGAHVYLGEYAKIQADGPIHASGHARRSELAQVFRFLKPRHVIPLHGELRQLMSCAEIAQEEGREWGLDPRNVFIVENGSVLNFQQAAQGSWNYSGIEKIEDIPRILRFENFIAESKDPFLRLRKRAALGGAVSLVINSAGAISVRAAGVLPAKDRTRQEELQAYLQDWGHERYRARLSKDWPRTEEAKEDLENDLSDELERYLRKMYGSRPLATVHLFGFL
jgi:ribonuclease J